MTSAVAAQVKGSGTWKEKQARSHNLIVHCEPTAAASSFFGHGTGLARTAKDPYRNCGATAKNICFPPPVLGRVNHVCKFNDAKAPLRASNPQNFSWGEGCHSTLQHLGRGIDHRRRFRNCEALKTNPSEWPICVVFSKLLLRLSIFRWEVNLLWWITLIVSFGCHLHSIF